MCLERTRPTGFGAQQLFGEGRAENSAGESGSHAQTHELKRRALGSRRTGASALHRASERVTAGTATGAGAGALGNLIDGPRTFRDGSGDVAIGNRFADADDHGVEASMQVLTHRGVELEVEYSFQQRTPVVKKK